MLSFMTAWREVVSLVSSSCNGNRQLPDGAVADCNVESQNTSTGGEGDTDGQGQRPEAVIVPSTHEEELVQIDISEVAWDEVGENGICK
jgi:hypothetical protein